VIQALQPPYRRAPPPGQQSRWCGSGGGSTAASGGYTTTDQAGGLQLPFTTNGVEETIAVTIGRGATDGVPPLHTVILGDDGGG